MTVTLSTIQLIALMRVIRHVDSHLRPCDDGAEYHPAAAGGTSAAGRTSAAGISFTAEESDALHRARLLLEQAEV